jgi:aspartyl-tRNA(Asn)/glutamyl-tRNA(Gln) amidotransferase subunit C
MVVDRAAIIGAVRLARLELSPEALDRITEQVADILAHVEELGAVPVDGVEAVAAIGEGGTPRRADEPGADALHVALAALAPAWQEGFFTVPRLASMESPEDAA